MRRLKVGSGSWSRTDGMELLWLCENGVGDFCGFDLDPGSAGLWILHAMYEWNLSENETPSKPQSQLGHRPGTRDLEALESLAVGHSPSNIWPADESWLIYTDWDLWGTKVYGPPELLGLIEADEYLGTVRLPAYRHMLNPSV